MTRNYAPPLERILSKTIYEGTCWLYTGAPSQLKNHTSPKITVNGANLHISTYSYDTLGPSFFGNLYIKPNKRLHNINHTCDFSNCWYPGHLYRGTQQQNNDDMMRRSRTNNAVGELARTHIISEATAIDIKKRLAKGGSVTAIAKRLDISVSIVRGIRYANKWKHVSI